LNVRPMYLKSVTGGGQVRLELTYVTARMQIIIKKRRINSDLI